MRHGLCCLVFCVAGMGLACSTSLGGQEPTPVIPAAATSPNTPAPKIKEKSAALTPLEEAEQFYRLGKFNKAIERYDAIIGSDTNNAVAYAGLARAYLKLKKSNDASLAAMKAVKLDPSLATTHSALGEVYFGQGKLQDAQTEFLTASKTGQADARTYLGLARLYTATYNFKKAKVAIDKAHSLDATDPDIGSAWVETRPRSEQVKVQEANIASQSNYYSRAEKAGFKQQLRIMRDEIEHPERVCGVAVQPESAEIQLTRIGTQKGFIGLEVHVNGVQSRLVLSTVSSGIVINNKIAEEAGVQPIARADMDALGEQNPPEVHIGFARSVKIGNLEFQNCYVTVVEEATPGSFYDQFEGLIAAGFFSAYLVDIDIPHTTLKLRPLPSRPAAEDKDSAAMDTSDPDAKNFYNRYTAPEMAAWTQMYHFGSAILIPAQVNDSPPELFEVATSSKYNVLAPEFARERASLKRDTQSAHLEGINGKVSDESTGKVKLALADLHFKAIRVISFGDTRSSDSEETGIAGYLGFDFLRNLELMIDYRDGLIHFVFAPRFPEGLQQSAP
jgi:tetratricopeptide (TPR) repeat protein